MGRIWPSGRSPDHLEKNQKLHLQTNHCCQQQKKLVGGDQMGLSAPLQQQPQGQHIECMFIWGWTGLTIEVVLEKDSIKLRDY